MVKKDALPDTFSTGELIRTRLYRPPIKPDHLLRQHLLQQLSDGFHGVATLISAPAGFGKSELASSWIETRGLPCGWVSLDETDNDLAAFVDDLVAAIKSVYPNLETQTQSLIESPLPPPAKIIARSLCDDVDLIDTRFVLVLDDIHRVEAENIFALLGELLNNPSPKIHLMLIGHWDPPLPMVALRACGQITEIRVANLRFSQAETSQLLHLLFDRDMDDTLAGSLTVQTEGWLMALRLAVVWMRHHETTTNLSELPISGDGRYLPDFLLEDVLEALPEPQRSWLLRVSLLDRFCAPLCEAICHPNDLSDSLTGVDFIAWLQDTNLSLVSLDDTGTWFRLHPMLQTQLQTLLRQDIDEDAISDLHMRAANWLSDHGAIDEAIQYALQVGQSDYAITLLAEHRYRLINNEDWYRLKQWVSRFPEAMTGYEPVLLATNGLLALIRGEFQALPKIRAAINYALHTRSGDSDLYRPVYAELRLFDAFDNIFRGSGEAVNQCGHDILTHIPDHAELHQAIGIGIKVIGHQMNGDMDAGAEIARKGLVNPDWSQKPLAQIQCWLHTAYFMDGRLATVIQSGSRSLARARQAKLYTTANHLIWLIGASHYLRNELDAAEQYLSELVETGATAGGTSYAYAVWTLVRIYLHTGRDAEADRVLEEALIWFNETDNRVSQMILRAFQVERALDEGELSTAGALAAEIDFSAMTLPWEYPTPQTTAVRLLLVEGTPESLASALAQVSELEAVLLQVNRKQHLIAVQAHYALVLNSLGDSAAACEKLKQAILLGQPDGFIRSFVDLGPDMEKLLRLLHKQHLPDLRDSCKYIDRILAAFPARSTSLPLHIDPLTEREQEIMCLLSTDRSTQDVANELSISLATVRTHIKNIYAKLDAHSRYEAIHRAQALNLL